MGHTFIKKWGKHYVVRVELYNTLKWPSEMTDLIWKIHIIVRAHTVYDVFAVTGYETLRIGYR